MSRVLLTGASGFIGQRALDHLAKRGDEIHATTRRRDAISGDAVWHVVDLLEPGAVTALVRTVRPNLLLHLAWTTTPGAFWTEPQNLDWAAATMEIHRAFRQAGGERAVYAGTCAEYDWDHDRLDEATTPLNPKTYYGTIRALLGRMLLASQEHDGPEVAWCRIFYLYGPGESRGRLVSDAIASLLAGHSFDCSDGAQQRDFMHVDDVGRALTAVLESRVKGAINIASGTCIPVRDLIDEIGRQTGRADLLRIGARPSSIHEPPRLAAEVAILRDGVGFVPRYNLSDGLADTVRWWRQQLAQG